jgi:diguanylate cyclase (GGDEF)-like protein
MALSVADVRYPGIPAELVQRVRSAAVPPYLSALFARLGVAVGLVVELPEGQDAAAVPTMALQLIKLAGQGTALQPAVLVSVAAGAPLQLRLEHGERRLRLAGEQLAGGKVALAGRIATELLGPGAAAEALERFAREAPRQDALRRLTRAMLETQSIHRLRQITLLGMTSGAALGFDRAALFVYDEDSRSLVGVSAIGPHDAGEAQRIRDSIEADDRTLEDLIEEHAASEVDTRLEALVRTLECPIASNDEHDEVAAALAASGPLCFDRARPVNPAIAALEPPDEFMVCAIKLRDRPLGVVVADNRFSRAPIDPEALGFISFLLDAAALVLENLRLLETVETLARHDGLTGLFNRREFETRLQEEQSRAQRLGSQCGLLLLDLDHFKAVNDSLGHRAGDELLQSVGVLLRSTLRAHDIVARFGGDEFAVLVTDTNAEQIQAIARRIGAGALGQGISLSVGGSLWPREDQEFSVLFAEADASLYEAKRAGRGRACIDRVEGVLVFAADSLAD